MRTLGGVLLGLLLFFPGIVLLQWLVKGLGIYGEVTLTDGCLVMIIVLLCVNLVRGTSPVGARAHAPKRRPARATRTADFHADPQLQFLPGDETPRERRRPTGRRTPSRRRDRER